MHNSSRMRFSIEPPLPSLDDNQLVFVIVRIDVSANIAAFANPLGLRRYRPHHTTLPRELGSQQLKSLDLQSAVWYEACPSILDGERCAKDSDKPKARLEWKPRIRTMLGRGSLESTTGPFSRACYAVVCSPPLGE